MHIVHAQDSVCLSVLSAVARMLPLHSFSLSRTVVKMLFLPLTVSVSSSSSIHCIVPGHYPVVSRNTHHCCVPPPPSSSSLSPLFSFDIVTSLQTLISCDTMHHGPSPCMDCVPPAQNSGRRAPVTLCLMLYSK